MADSNSLLSSSPQRYTRDVEDVATDALSFTLSRSTSARRALSEFLEGPTSPSPYRQVPTHWDEVKPASWGDGG